MRTGAVAAATALFAAGAAGLIGSWALGAAVVLLVGIAVATAIAWEEQEARDVGVPDHLEELISAQSGSPSPAS